MWNYSKCQPCCCCKLVLHQTCLLQSHITTLCRSIPLEELVAFDESPSWRSSEEKTKNRLWQQMNKDTQKKSSVLRFCAPLLAFVLCLCPLNMSNWNWKKCDISGFRKISFRWKNLLWTKQFQQQCSSLDSSYVRRGHAAKCVIRTEPIYSIEDDLSWAKINLNELRCTQIL